MQADEAFLVRQPDDERKRRDARDTSEGSAAELGESRPHTRIPVGEYGFFFTKNSNQCTMIYIF